MGEKTSISWTHRTMNWWWGCMKVSPGCDHCYAETLAHRMGKDFSKPWRTSAANWTLPKKWEREAVASGVQDYVFTNSMSDFFDPRVPAEWRFEAWQIMMKTPHINWQVLTKRPAMMLNWATEHPWLPNIWAGVSVESQDYTWRLDALTTLKELYPHVTTFVSCEPLLGELDLRKWLGLRFDTPKRTLDWVIVGGESGDNYRPMETWWVDFIAKDCHSVFVPKERHTPIWVKQDSGRFPGKQGRIPDKLWALKELPIATTGPSL